jgi:predicted nicotinamide N-methyase
MSVVSDFQQQYETDTETIGINGRRFKLFVPRHLERFIDGEASVRDFPLWAKIWRASWVLADHLARMPAREDQTLLEIGAGLGLVGIVAAGFGHRVTLTEHNPDALAFARANAALNRSPGIEVRPLNWHHPAMGRTFDTIVGSEVIYHPEDIVPLRKVFQQCLKSAGRIILAMEFRQTLTAFFDQMSDTYKISMMRKRLRGDDQAVPVLISELSLRNGS